MNVFINIIRSLKPINCLCTLFITREKVMRGKFIIALAIGLICSLPALAAESKISEKQSPAPALPWPVKGVKFPDNGILDITLGNEDAPITIHEISAVTCLHCATFHKKIFPEIKRKYIDTGIARLVLRHCPIDGVSLRAAIALSKTPKSQRYQAVEAMWESQPQWFPQDFSPKNLMKFSQDMERFCKIPAEQILRYINDDKLAEDIVKDRYSLDQSIQIDGTPTFIVNGEVLLQSATFENIDALMQKHLEEAKLNGRK